MLFYIPHDSIIDIIIRNNNNNDRSRTLATCVSLVYDVTRRSKYGRPQLAEFRVNLPWEFGNGFCRTSGSESEPIVTWNSLSTSSSSSSGHRRQKTTIITVPRRIGHRKTLETLYPSSSSSSEVHILTITR